METKKVYVVRPFDRLKGIMTPVRVFDSAEAILNWYKGSTITDEFGRIRKLDALKDYINGGNATIKVVAEIPKGGLFDLLDILPPKPEYYHIDLKGIIN